MKYRAIPEKSDKDGFCTGRYGCYRFACNLHDCEIPSCQYFCLGFNAGGGFEGMSIFPDLKREEGFKPFIPSDMPTFHTCCVEQCCCFRVAMCQPCFGLCGDPEGDKWTKLVDSQYLCFRGQPMAPKGYCQYWCLRFNTSGL